MITNQNQTIKLIPIDFAFSPKVIDTSEAIERKIRESRIERKTSNKKCDSSLEPMFKIRISPAEIKPRRRVAVMAIPRPRYFPNTASFRLMGCIKSNSHDSLAPVKLFAPIMRAIRGTRIRARFSKLTAGFKKVLPPPLTIPEYATVESRRIKRIAKKKNHLFLMASKN